MPRPLICGLLALLSATPAFGAFETPVVGMNLTGLGPITTAWDVTDLMKASNAWNSGAVSTSTFNSDNWPVAIPAGQNVGTNVRLPVSNRLPNIPLGTYTVTWEGAGTFALNGGGGSLFRNATGAGSATFTVTAPDQQLFIQLSNIPAGTSNPLRNIRILMPDHGPGQVNGGETFNATFLQRFSPFKATRFMDWGSTNTNTLVNWADRPLPSNRTYATSKGVPVETMVAYANRQKSDPWFCIPVQAGDDYVRQMATMVRDSVDASLTVYVEYGNEVWNPGFTVEHGHVRALAASRYGNADLWYRAWADEAKRDFAIWKEVFDAAGQGSRLKRVAAAQTVNRFHSPRFLNQMYSNPSDTSPSGTRMFDVLAMGAYLGVPSSGYTAATTKDKILDDLFADLAANMNSAVGTDGLPTGNFRWNKWLADQHGVPLMAYEGGQHVVPTNNSTTLPWYDDYIAAQRDPRMGQLYGSLLISYLETLGAEGFMNFASVSEINQFGAWGALETGASLPSQSPKYQALTAFIQRSAVVPEPVACLLVVPAALLTRRGR